MSNDSIKNWDKAWNTEEIVNQADNWNLACDAALLNTLKAFGDRVLNISEEVHTKVDTLFCNLNQINLRVDLVWNEFNSLQNSQFVECRVYEEDDILHMKQNQEEKAEYDLHNDETIEDSKKAIDLALHILDEYYDKVEVPVSDSEDDDEVNIPSYVYRRKDPYIQRPLPYVIGSEKWYKKWHVGLEESSDSECEKSPSEKFSDSEIDDNFEIKNSSDESSELPASDYSKEQPVAVSSTNTTETNNFFPPTIDSSSPPHTMPTMSSFAEQLAVKLGNVIKENDGVLEEPEVNRKSIRKNPSDYGIIFSDDEPPPFDENIIKEQESHGIFSGGKGLFDDEDDDNDSLWSPVTSKNSSRIENLGSNKTGLTVARTVQKPAESVPFGNNRKLENMSDSRFSHNFNEDVSSPTISKDILEANPISVSRNEQIIRNVPEVPKKIGTQFSHEKSNNLCEDNEPAERKILKPTIKPNSLFDDIFQDDLFSDTNKNFTSNLFSEDLFAESDVIKSSEPDKRPSNSAPTTTSKKENQDRSEYKLYKEGQTVVKNDNYSSKDISKNKIESLFDDTVENDFDTFLWDKSSNLNQQNEKMQQISENKVKHKNKSDMKKKFNLFDDESVDVDDAFTNILKSGLDENRFDSKLSPKKEMFNSESFQQKPDISEKPEKVEFSREANINTESTILQTKKLSDYNLSKKTSDGAKLMTEQPIGEIQSYNSNIVDEIQENIEGTRSGDSSWKNSSKLDKNRQEDIFREQHVPTGHKASDLYSKTKTKPANFTQPPFTDARSTMNIPKVDFLDTIPPPDDGWDNTSDNNLDDIEPYGYDSFQSQPSSLFDSEPPLFFNETSGIAKDILENSLDSLNSIDQSLLTSRRFGSDIFSNNDRNFENSDKEFYKNSISSDDASINIRGISENLFTDGTTHDKLKNMEPDNKNKMSILDDLCDKESECLQPSLSVKNQDMDEFINREYVICDNSVERRSLDKNVVVNENDSKEESFLQDERDEMLNNISKIAVRLQQTSNKQEDKSKLAVVSGKLSHNLNINVEALLPGSVPPRREKIQSADAKTIDASSEESDFWKMPIPIMKSQSETHSIGRDYRLERSVSFDNAAEVEVLQSVTKNRPKIQGKRKPSSRKARHQLLKDSAPDRQVAEEELIQSFLIPHELRQKTEIITQIEDLERLKNQKHSLNIKTEISDTPALITLMEPTISNQKKSISLFDDDEDDTEDIFKTLTKNTRNFNHTKDVYMKQESRSLFGNMPSEPIYMNAEVDKLFNTSDDKVELWKNNEKASASTITESTTKNKKPHDPNIANFEERASTSKRNDQNVKSPERTLFGSSDEDDDFLKSLSKSKVEKQEKKIKKSSLKTKIANTTIYDIEPSVTNKKTPKSSSLRKLDNVEVDEDPLTAMLK